MSSDPTPFKAPDRYPDPPKDMYYEVPKTPTYQKPAPIFPWEKDAPKPTRVFAEDNVEVYETHSIVDSDPTPVDDDTNPNVATSSPTIRITAADPWQSFTSGGSINAWDNMPEIERYIGNLQKNRKGNIQVLQGYGAGIEQVSSPGARRHSMKLTDFPTEMERPSLPVTPAPIRRPSFWGEERDEEGELPAAEGVPSQEDWVSFVLTLATTDSNLPAAAGSSGSAGTISKTSIRCTCQQTWEGVWTRHSDEAIAVWIGRGYFTHLYTSGPH
jgi:glycogenin glucosyltransferase